MTKDQIDAIVQAIEERLDGREAAVAAMEASLKQRIDIFEVAVAALSEEKPHLAIVLREQAKAAGWPIQ